MNVVPPLPTWMVLILDIPAIVDPPETTSPLVIDPTSRVTIDEIPVT